MNGKLRHIERRRAALDKEKSRELQEMRMNSLVEDIISLTESLRKNGVDIPEENKDWVIDQPWNEETLLVLWNGLVKLERGL